MPILILNSVHVRTRSDCLPGWGEVIFTAHVCPGSLFGKWQTRQDQYRACSLTMMNSRDKYCLENIT